MIDLTNLVNAVVALLAAIITAFVIPCIKAKATEKQLDLLAKATKTAVFAAEQVYGSGWGQEKMRYAKDYLKAHGYTIDEDMIEATVKEYFGHIEIESDTEEESEEESTEDEDPQTPLM